MIPIRKEIVGRACSVATGNIELQKESHFPALALNQSHGKIRLRNTHGTEEIGISTASPKCRGDEVSLRITPDAGQVDLKHQALNAECRDAVLQSYDRSTVSYPKVTPCLQKSRPF